MKLSHFFNVGSGGKHSLVSLPKALLLFVISLVVGTTGFILIEGYSIHDACYMAIITISTVGFEEVKPLTTNGQIFASFYIILILVYLLIQFRPLVFILFMARYSRPLNFRKWKEKLEN